jgi:cytochrome c oxidase subunit 2
MVMMGYALLKFRAKPGDEGDGEPIHGNTRLEVAWTVIPTVIVLFGAGFSWATLRNIEERHPGYMNVNVYSQQYAWNFTYPGPDKFSRGVLHVPVDRQVVFSMHALDVIHSFWVPEWRIKKDNVPGITTQAVVTPDRLGTYQRSAPRLCGFRPLDDARDCRGRVPAGLPEVAVDPVESRRLNHRRRQGRRRHRCRTRPAGQRRAEAHRQEVGRWRR